MKTRAVLAITAAVAALLTGCGGGSAPASAGPTSGVNPHLAGIASRLSTVESAVILAGTIAAGWAVTDAAESTPDTSIEFTTVEYSASVFNPDLRSGFTAFLTLRRTMLVTPASAATITTTNDAPPRFATPTDRALWLADSNPALGQAPASGQRLGIPAGQFSFLPQGSTLTFQQAAALPGEPDTLRATILAHLRPYAGAHPPASLELKQLGYLIATAPLTNPARAAAWDVIALLPGLHTCRTDHRLRQAGSFELCIQSPTDETRLTVSTETGAVLTVADRLLAPSRMYPHVPAGTVIGSSTFPG
jgi:hypothetical protein